MPSPSPTPLQNNLLNSPLSLVSWSRRAIITRAVIAILVLVTSGIPATLSIPRLLATMRNSPGSWLEDDEVTWAKWRTFCERHQFFDVVMVTWPGCHLQDPSIDAVVQDLKQLTQTTNERQAWVTSLMSGNDAFVQLVSPPMNLPDVAARKRLQGVFLDPKEAQQTCIVLSIAAAADLHKHEMLVEIRQRTAKVLNMPPEEIVVVGPPVEGDAIDQASRDSMTDFALPSTILGALICWISLRSIPLTAAVMAVAIWSQSISLAIIWWSGREMNAVFTILPVLCLVLAVSSGIHLSNYYRDSVRSHPNDRLLAISSGMLHGLHPCFLAVATTCMGLLSLAWVKLWPVQWFGYVAAIALIGTLLLQFCLLPLAMLLEKRKDKPTTQAPSNAQNKSAQVATVGDQYLSWHGLQVLKYKYVILLAMLASMIGTGLGIERLEASVKIDRMLRPDDPLCEEYKWFEDHVGSLVTAEAEVVFPNGVVEDPFERFQLVRQAHFQMMASADVDGVLSIVTFLPSPPKDGEVSVSATARRSVIRRRLRTETEALAKAGLITRDSKNEYWRLSVRYPHRIEGSYSERLKETEDSLRPLLRSVDPKIGLDLLGSIPIAEYAQDALLQGLTNSFLSAFAIIYCVLLWITRRVWSSLLLMLPNLFPTCVVFGILGWASIPLDIGIVMTASVALGIAVDDTLHFLFAYRDGCQGDRTRTSSILHALKICGRAMFQTTLICGLSMAVYLFSDFAPAQRFAVLMILLLAVALLADLFILPAILGSNLDRKLFRKPGV